VIFGLFQPICYLLLFAPLLKDVASAPVFPDSNALTVFTPGLLVMQGILGTTFVGFGLIAQLRGGVIERLRVTPVNRLALLLGNALRDVVILAVQAFLLVLVARFLGLEADPIGVVSVLGLLVMLGLLTASCSYALAILLKDENAFASTLNFFLFPVLLLSGVFLPLTLAPAWIQNAAAINPFSYAVDAARALFNGDFGDATVVYGFGIIAVLSLLALWWAARSFRRATA
jgi:ABC-2 type transport system permease protein